MTRHTPETNLETIKLALETEGDQKLIAEEFLQVTATALRKNHDYGSGVWSPPVLAPNISADMAIRVRMSDKLARIRQLEALSASPQVEESLDDTYMDLGVYCILKVINPNKE